MKSTCQLGSACAPSPDRPRCVLRVKRNWLFLPWRRVRAGNGQVWKKTVFHVCIRWVRYVHEMTMFNHQYLNITVVAVALRQLPYPKNAECYVTLSWSTCNTRLTEICAKIDPMIIFIVIQLQTQRQTPSHPKTWVNHRFLWASFCVAITCPTIKMSGCFKFQERMTQRGLKWIKRPWHAPCASTEIWPIFSSALRPRWWKPSAVCGAVVFTRSRSLAIAPFSLQAVALWKMGSWKNILWIFIPNFSLHFRFILCIWKRICLNSSSSCYPKPFKGQASPRLACLCQAFRCNQAILQSREWTNKRTNKVSQGTRLEQSPDTQWRRH